MRYASCAEKCRTPRPFPPKRLAELHQAQLEEIANGRCVSSRGRANPRGVKRKYSAYKVRRRGAVLNQKHQPVPVITN